MLKIQRIFIQGWKFFIAMVIVLFTLEVCTRLDDTIKYGAPLLGDYSSYNLRRRNSDGLLYNVPNAKFEKWQHNSLGFRGPEIMQNKPSGTVRVVCMGASESYGLHESPGKEWPSQLQEQLPAPKFEIINASVAGFSLRSYDAYLKKHVFPLKPDIIILVISPLMYVSSIENEATRKNFPPKTSGKSKSKDTSLISNLMWKLRILVKINQTINQFAINNLPNMSKRFQLWKTRKQIEEIERVRLKGRKPMDSVPDMFLDNFHKTLNRLVESIQSEGIEVMLSSYPTLISNKNMSQYPEIFLNNRRFHIYLSLEGMVDTVVKFNNMIERVSLERHTIFVDLASLLPKSTDFFADNIHYTDNGANHVAEGIAVKFFSEEDPHIARAH